MDSPAVEAAVLAPFYGLVASLWPSLIPVCSCHLRQACEARAVQRSPAHVVRRLHESLQGWRRFETRRRKSCTLAPASILNKCSWDSRLSSGHRRKSHCRLKRCEQTSRTWQLFCTLTVALEKRQQERICSRFVSLKGKTDCQCPSARELFRSANASAQSTAVSSPGAPRA